MAFNDVSARDLQAQTSQRTVGEVVQHAHTGRMIFSVARIVAFLSRTMTLVPGDIVVTVTLEGVGAHRTPARFLGDGDVVEITVGGERLSNPVVAT
jgi:2-keto-4-pentenoate hydratase/2-oxohepta-3-ene-1,7-dioic acid hydratase in catechol pathway